jgi:hypothetical protein
MKYNMSKDAKQMNTRKWTEKAAGTNSERHAILRNAVSDFQSFGGESVNERGLDSCGINWAPGRTTPGIKGESNHTKVSADARIR